MSVPSLHGSRTLGKASGERSPSPGVNLPQIGGKQNGFGESLKSTRPSQTFTASSMSEVLGTRSKESWIFRSSKIPADVKSLLAVYRNAARSDQKGITAAEFRKSFVLSDVITHRLGSNMAKEICDDMFAVLDKKHKGFVTPQEWIRHFYPAKPGSKALPKVGVEDVFGRKKMQVTKVETPRLPEDLENVLRDVFKLWGMDTAQDGVLTRNELLKTLSGQRGGGLSWKEAEEAVDSLFNKLPRGQQHVTFHNFANHFQDVIAVPYTQLLAGQTTRYRSHAPPLPPVPRTRKKSISSPDPLHFTEYSSDHRMESPTVMFAKRADADHQPQQFPTSSEDKGVPLQEK